jgi:predicted phage terminase large subunit-like protein
MEIPKGKLELIKYIEELEELEKKVDATYYSKRFWEFNKDIMKWPDLYEPLHRKVCNFIQDNIKKKMILLLLPRGTFKSTVVTVSYPLFRIAGNPNSRGLLANATYPMATSFLSQIKSTLEKNEGFRNIYGDMSTDAPIWREEAIALNTEDSFRSKEPTLTALGVGSNYTGKHFDYAILDDLVNRDNIGTMDRIEEVKNFYKDVLDLVDPDENNHKQIIIIGTCWHQSDLYSWIEDPETGISDDFAIMKLPAFGKFSGDRWEGEWGKDELLFPARLNWETMENLKRSQGTSHFSAQYLLNPVPEESATFKNFRYYDKSDIKGLKLNIFIAVDPALTEKKESDYSAMVCVGIDSQNNWYILDLWRDKVNPKKLIDQIFFWDAIHKPISTAIESTAFQKTIRFFLSEEMKKRGHYIPIKELVHTDRSKEERIKGLEPRCEAGAVFFNKDDNLTKYILDEMRRFPKGKNDDLIDALASINEIGFPPRKQEYRKDSSRGSDFYPA